MLIITLSIIIVMFLVNVTLSVLNYKNRTAPIPENVKGIYNDSEYNNWLNYTMEVFRLGIIRKSVNTLFLIGFLIFGLFPKLNEISELITSDVKVQTVLFFIFYAIINYFINLGFDLYSTFNIEERYGFNKTTVKTYIGDTIKKTILAFGLGGGLLYLVHTLYLILGVTSLFYVWAIVLAIYLIFTMLYTRVFVKIFYKITPLEEGELLDGAIEMAEKLGYKIKNVSIMNASKRSSRLNAYFIGFGKFKSIVLFDTLVEKCSTDEILSVLAHEIGHAKNKDTIKGIVSFCFYFALYLFILSFFLTSNTLLTSFGFSSLHFGFSIILFEILYEPISFLFNIPSAIASRKHEYAADKVAKDAGYGEALIQSLKILAKENFANLTPHPLLVKLTYSHPPINDRIEALIKE